MKTLCSVGLLLCAAALPVHGGVIAADDFNTGIHYPYSWALAMSSEGTLPDPPSTSVVGPVGVGGSQGLLINADFSSVVFPTPNSYTLLIFGGGTYIAPSTGEIHSANPADYSFSMDYRAGGLLSPTTRMQVQLRFYGSAGVLLQLDRHDLAASASFQHVSGDLSTWSISQGSWAQVLADPAQVSWVDVNVSFPDGATDFGLKADNLLILDNLRLESVPEPGAGCLLLTGAAACWFRWRRNRRA